MKFSFDIRGYLEPYGKNNSDLESLKNNLVDGIANSESRQKLYEGYLKYNEDLKALLGDQRYTQWIDGSFVSNKINPKDIDLVNLIDHKLVEQYEHELGRFIMLEGKKIYGVDGYIVTIYPEGHPKYVLTQSDLVYWESWFSKSRKNVKKQRHPKGFLELEF